tara:strand:+ start:1398 stop:2213 length:816 start_codon:yes stop_codon:yes gene_type:complete
MPDEVFCQTELNYVTAHGVEPKDVTILNGRMSTSGAGWERRGFELFAHHSNVLNWDDDNEVASLYYGEMTSLAKALSGCTHALMEGHINRNPRQAAVHPDYAPIRFVHSDFTESYGKAICEYYESDEDGPRNALKRANVAPEAVRASTRILILQFWRNVGEPRMDLPLAICDAESVSREELQDFHVSSYAGGDFGFDTFGVRAPGSDDQHRWFTFPEMTIQEVLTLRTYDSERAALGKPFWTPHSAFQDPSVTAGNPARKSIEVRATCLFE